MDFAFSEEEQAFRTELRAFLEVELPYWWRGMFVDDERAIPLTREICGKLAERGWLTIAWPPEHGGRGASPWMQTILREEMWAREEPRGPQYMNLNYIGPLLMRFGTAEQRAQFLPPMARGEVIWCQGFSEPDAGSDLASLRTRAVDRADHFVVNGRKIWTSYADAPAQWCLLLVRTDPDVPKHDGISVLLVDMEAPGITVRPIDTMAGPHEFNDVSFDDVVVPRSHLLGEQDHGWDVIVTGLAFERVGIARYARAGAVLERLIEHANETGLAGDPRVRQQLADLRARYEAARLLAYRAVSRQATGEVPTVEASIARIHATLLEQEVGHVGLELLGPVGLLRAADPWASLRGEIHRQWVRNIPTTVAAGTLEVQKDVVARRGLG
ncbi:MAG: acyl-CoA dehydrogenase family protein, partial [Actinomycetota bacterium]